MVQYYVTMSYDLISCDTTINYTIQYPYHTIKYKYVCTSIAFRINIKQLLLENWIVFFLYALYDLSKVCIVFKHDTWLYKYAWAFYQLTVWAFALLLFAINLNFKSCVLCNTKKIEVLFFLTHRKQHFVF